MLLDTNVLSEVRKPKLIANEGVRTWFASQRPSELFLSVITILEIELGIARLERRDGFQAQMLQRWLEEEVLDAFSERLLEVDVEVARIAARMHVPDPRSERDALIAATAKVHGLTVVTHNTKDFVTLGVRMIDPWAK